MCLSEDLMTEGNILSFTEVKEFWPVSEISILRSDCILWQRYHSWYHFMTMHISCTTASSFLWFLLPQSLY